MADEAYKTQQALDLKTGGGADVIAIDGIWVGEFAQAGYIKPLDEIGGQAVASWDGWSAIPKAVQSNMSFQGKRYGVPSGTDGRVLFFNKTLFQQAGISTKWQPRSWADIIATARKLKAKLPDVTPLQINAGTAMGEATTAQGFLPLLVGTGKNIYDTQAQQVARQHEEHPRRARLLPAGLPRQARARQRRPAAPGRRARPLVPGVLAGQDRDPRRGRLPLARRGQPEAAGSTR